MYSKRLTIFSVALFLGLVASGFVGCLDSRIGPTDSFAPDDLFSLAAAAAYEVTTPGNAPAPSPAPTPDGSAPGVCSDCLGKGTVGDGRVSVECGTCLGTGRVPPPSTEPEPEPEAEAPLALSPVYRRTKTRWTVAGKRNYSDAELARHLMQDHGIDSSGRSREEMQAMHDNTHDGYPADGGNVTQATTRSRSSSSCPTGRCPTR